MNRVYQPDLSIIIPTYNRLDFLKEALDSFVGKVTCTYEVIIVDDGSTDGTRAYLESLSEPIQVILQAHLGPQSARNAGIARACGQFLKFHDDDDVLDPSAIDAQVEYMKTHPDIDVCYSDWGFATYRNRQLMARWMYVMKEIPDPVEYLIRDWWCVPFSYLFRRRILEGLRWDETPVVTDFIFVADVVLRGARFGYAPTSPNPIGWYRAIVDKEKRVSLSASNVVRAQTELKILEKMENQLTRTGTLTVFRRQALAMRYYSIAKRVFPDDRAMFRQLVSKVKQIDPGFQPEGARYQMLIRWLGYERAEWLRRLNLKLRARRHAATKPALPVDTITYIHVDKQTVIPKY